MRGSGGPSPAWCCLGSTACAGLQHLEKLVGLRQSVLTPILVSELLESYVRRLAAEGSWLLEMYNSQPWHAPADCSISCAVGCERCAQRICHWAGGLLCGLLLMS